MAKDFFVVTVSSGEANLSLARKYHIIGSKLTPGILQQEGAFRDSFCGVDRKAICSKEIFGRADGAPIINRIWISMTWIWVYYIYFGAK